VQLGAIGTTYVKDYQVKFTMAVIMLTVLFSRFFYIPGYLGQLGLIEPLAKDTVKMLKTGGDIILVVALLVGAYTVLSALAKGMKAHKEKQAVLARAAMAD
jgi:type VI protein secretion system component VasK